MRFFGDGENAKMIRLLTQHEHLPRIDISDPEQVRQRIMEYFQFCIKHNLMPQIIGMSDWIGISRDTLNSWKRGEFPGRKEHQKIIEMGYSIIEEVMIAKLLDNRIPAASGIFLLKNCFNYADRVEVGFEAKQDPFDGLNNEEVRKRIIEQYGIDEEGSDSD